MMMSGTRKVLMQLFCHILREIKMAIFLRHQNIFNNLQNIYKCILLKLVVIIQYEQ